jgi:hypothetical protein
MTRLLIPLLLLASSSAFAGSHDRWYKCESSDDCILARGPCGAATAINRSFRWLFEKTAKNSACTETLDFKKDKKLKTAGCGLEGKCVTGTRTNVK